MNADMFQQSVTTSLFEIGVDRGVILRFNVALISQAAQHGFTLQRGKAAPINVDSAA
jgi:hypothetical protein